MRHRPALADLALTSAAKNAVAQTTVLIQHTHRNIAATQHLIEQGRQSIKRSLEWLQRLSSKQF